MTMMRQSVLLLGWMSLATGLLATDAAEARGGGSSFMNSPGYQRRLQESRGYVTNQSGSILAPPAAVAAPRPHLRPKRHHRR
jgi:hypothetical protein